MQLFIADDVVLRPSEIIRRTKRSQFSVFKELGRLVKRGQLFRIAHSQYTRSATTTPIAKMRNDRIATLERQVEEMWAEIRLLVRQMNSLGGPPK